MQDVILELIEIGQELHQRGWLPATAGNISARVEDKIAISASGTHKGYLKKDDFVILDLDGNKIEGMGKPSAETLLHLEVYKHYPWVKSVLHVHSVNSTIISKVFNKIELKDYELLKAFDNINTHEAKMNVPILENSQDMKTLSDILEGYLKSYENLQGFLLKAHGLYTWGKSIKEAFYKVEAFDFLFECELKLKV